MNDDDATFRIIVLLVLGALLCVLAGMAFAGDTYLGKARTPDPMQITATTQAAAIDTNCLMWVMPRDEIDLAGTYYDYSDGTRSTTNDATQTTGADRPAYTNIGTYDGSITRAYLFDGADDNIQIPSPSFSSDTAGTVMGWIKGVDDTDSWPLICYGGGNGPNFDGRCVIRREASGAGSQPRQLKIQQCSDGAGLINIVTGGSTLTTGTWYHVAWTSSGTAWTIVLNGSAESLTVQSAANNGNWFGDTTVTATGEYRIGSQKIAGGFSYANAYFNDVRYFDRQLTTNEIQAVYNRTKERYGL